MFDKIKEKLSFLNEHYFNVAFIAVSALLTFLSYKYQVQDLQILSVMLLRVGTFLFIGCSFVTFLNGIGFDIKKEIFEENNSAAAIFTAGFWIALAVAISVSL